MVGSFNDGRNNYRCSCAAEYADTDRIAHPRSVHLREDHVPEQLDPWLAEVLSPSRLATTVQAMAAAQDDDEPELQAVHPARETLATCRTRLDRYRAALDKGADPGTVSQWIADVQWPGGGQTALWPRPVTRGPGVPSCPRHGATSIQYATTRRSESVSLADGLLRLGV